MENILSHAEVDALMDAMTEGEERETAPDEASSALSYDLTSQDRIVRGRLPGLDHIHDRCARNISRDLGLMLRAQVRVVAEPGALIRHSEMLALLPSPAKLAILRMHPFSGFSLLSLDPSLVQRLLAAILGGDLGEDEGRTEVTPVQERLLKRLFNAVTVNLEKAWESVAKMQFEVARVEFDPQLASIGVGTDLVLASSFEVNIDDEEAGRIVLATPFASLEPVRKALGDAVSGDDDSGKSVAAHAIEAHILATSAELRCIFGQADMTVRELLDLRVDDVIRLESGPNMPLQCLLEGQARFNGHPVVQAGNIACAIDAIISQKGSRND